LLLLLLCPDPCGAASNKVRITNLSDLSFGTVANLAQDAIRSESVCLYADTATNGYHVTATGTGPGGAFQLSSGARTLAYDVQWSSTAGQNSGAQLTPNVPLTGQISSAAQQVCSSGPLTTASLIIVLRSAALSSATAGSYNGTLTLVIGPE
jgi:spore coat protein U-like protein